MKSTNDETEIMTVTRKVLKLPQAAYLRVAPIMKGGSARAFFRISYSAKNLDSLHPGNDSFSLTSLAATPDQRNIKKAGGTVIFMWYDKNREENNYYAPIGEFLFNIGVKTPRIIYHNPQKGFIVMEDLGDEDLWSFRDKSWEVRSGYYFKTLEIAHKLHNFPLKEFPSERVPLMEAFSPDFYRWEQDYFLDNFVKAVCRVALDPFIIQSLEEEFTYLAERLGEQGKTLVHRDFQSHNVMIHEGETVLIDFQGMRFGSPFYDLGSLLYDPYCVFSENERLELLYYYYGLAETRQKWEEFQKMFVLAAAQRLMQALGAYGYLGMELQKHDFLEHIPNGLNNILDATARCQCLPELEKLCRRCQETLRGC